MNERDKELAKQAGFWQEHTNTWMCTGEAIKKFADIVRADEREAIIDEWWSVVQGDLENGVKCLNEQAATKWKKEYPSMATFGEWLKARGNT